MQRNTETNRNDEVKLPEKDDKNQTPFLYVIRKTDENGIYNQLIDHLKKLNVVGKSVVIKEDGIYFKHNMKEMSFLLGKFISKILDYQRYFDIPYAKGMPCLDEYHIFEMNLIKSTAGIKIEACGPPAKEKALERIKMIRANEPKTVPLQELTPDENPSLLHSVKGALTQHDGVSVGETHTAIEGKQIIIYLMSQNIPDVTHLYAEVGFSDTQKELYETFNKTGQMPQILLHCLIGEDVSMRMIKIKDKDLIGAYQHNPFGYLGMVVMAHMKGMAVIPLDVRESFDSAHSMYESVNSQSFQEKRCLIMNVNSYEIIRDDTNKKKYFVYDGSSHNVSNAFFDIPGIPAMLDIPYVTDQDWKGQIPACDVYTQALLIHNISRVLLGKPVKVYDPPAQKPDTVSGCLQLIFLQELAQEVNNKDWDKKGHKLMKFIPHESTPTQIIKLRNALSSLNQLNTEKDIYQKFTDILMLLQSGFTDTSIKLSQPLQDTTDYFKEKFLQGMDLMDSSFRLRHYSEALPPILGYNQEPITESKPSPEIKR